MDVLIIIGIILVAVVVGAVFFYLKKKKGMDMMFLQVYESAKQIPKQKRQSFLLLMFNENIQASKSKNPSPSGKLNNPKYLEMQMMIMSNIIKDRTKATDKNIKRALQLFDAYLAWEKSFNSKDKKAS